MAAAVAAWQPPAAKEGQGDCDFPLGPPWILLYPLKRRRSAMGREAAGRSVLARRSALLQMVSMLLCVLSLPCGLHDNIHASLLAKDKTCGSLFGQNRCKNATQNPKISGRTQRNIPRPLKQGRAKHQNVLPCRLHPHSGAAAVQRGTRESKEGVGGTRNPPIPPWPPEAATR